MTLPNETVEATGYAIHLAPANEPHLITSAVAQTSSGGDVQVRFEKNNATIFTVFLPPEDWKNIADAAQNVYRSSQDD